MEPPPPALGSQSCFHMTQVPTTFSNGLSRARDRCSFGVCRACEVERKIDPPHSGHPAGAAGAVVGSDNDMGLERIGTEVSERVTAPSSLICRGRAGKCGFLGNNE